jgi:hypothetical protein
MRVVDGVPPNFDEILAAFPGIEMPGVMFCWGNTIYAPGMTSVADHFHAHESIHAIQQGDDPSGWWKTYISSSAFRLEQEIPAHRAEFEFRCKSLSRKKRRMLLRETAGKLASPLYGSLISVGKAKAALRGG